MSAFYKSGSVYCDSLAQAAVCWDWGGVSLALAVMFFGVDGDSL